MLVVLVVCTVFRTLWKKVYDCERAEREKKSAFETLGGAFLFLSIFKLSQDPVKQAELICAQLPSQREQECAKVGLRGQRGLFRMGMTRKWSSSALCGCYGNGTQLGCGVLCRERWMENVRKLNFILTERLQMFCFISLLLCPDEKPFFVCVCESESEWEEPENMADRDCDHGKQ